MTLPVSSYEELLVQVRELTHETILLRRQLSSDLFENVDPTDLNHNLSLIQNHYEKGKLVSESVLRHCDQNHRIGPETVTFCDRSFQPRLNPDLATTNDVLTEELSTKLNAWCNQNQNSYREVEGNNAVVERFDSIQGQQPLKQRLNLCSHTPSSVVATLSASGEERVGVEGTTSTTTTSTTTVSNIHESNKVEHDFGFCRGKSADDDDNGSKNQQLLSTSSSSSDNSKWNQRNIIVDDESRTRIINATKSRGNQQLSSTIIDSRSLPKQQNVMEPEHKDEIDHESGSPSPELFGRSGSKGYENDASSEDESRPSSSLQTQRLSSLYHGTWPVKRDVWNNQQYNFPNQQSTSTTIHNDMASIMSFSSASGVGSSSTSTQGIQSHRRLGAKVDVVYSLLGMLGRSEGRDDMSSTLLTMSNSIESCRVMRQSGCLPLLVQLIHAPGQNHETRERASRALHNIIQARSDERTGRREVRVLRLLEQLRDYCQSLRLSLESTRDDLERHPGATIAALMKLSFDEDHRHAMCQLGGLHAVAELIEMDHTAHGSECEDQNCITLRRYAGMALTNLTFGDGNNKALLCSFKDFMRALVSQLQSTSDDLRQVTASVLRNLSWRADSSSKQTLREVGAVIGLMRAAMEGKKESTLKSILSALWNLSAHCSTNKVDICAVEGALAFLVDMLSYKAPSKNFAIVENAGGILRNVSSHIAVRDDYRTIVRERGCLQVLLRQLRSPSLTIVSNACGALWNLSARCTHDQRLLWDLGAVPMLRSLVHSKHKMISMGSSAALKNLLSARPGGNNLVHLDSTARGLGLSTLPTLVARRQKALEQEIDQNLAETCENIEPSTSPIEKFAFKLENPGKLQQPGTSGIKFPRSESRESMRSVTSTHSDTIFEKVKMNGTIDHQHQQQQQSASLHSAMGFEIGPIGDTVKCSQSEKKYALRYKNSNRMKPDGDSLIKRTGSTISWSTHDQEATCSQALHSSIEDRLSQTSSCDYSFSSDHHNQQKLELGIRATDGENKNRIEGKNEISSIMKLEKIENLEHPFYADETTNYSLRYAEHTSDDEKQSSAYFTCSEQNVLNGDTVKTYCTEGTPSQLSLNSSRATSASDLQEDIRPRNLFRVITGSKISAHHFDEQITSGEDSGAASYRSLTIDDEHKITDDSKHKEFERKSRKTSSPCPVNIISEDDDDDDDQGLLAACINIGMQNNRHRQSFRRNSLEEEELQAECNLTRYQTSNELNRVDNTSVTSTGETLKNSRYSMQEITCDFQNEPSKELIKEISITQQAEKSCIKIPEFEVTSKASTGSVEISSEEIVISGSCESFDSVERSEQALLEFCIQTQIPKVTNDSSSSLSNIATCEQEIVKSTEGDTVDAVSKSKINILTEETIKNTANDNEEENQKVEEVYRRQRDPDAMIASLDRLTATLVQQTEAMRERDSSAMKQSLQSDSWNEDSPNDVSFPSISVSAPLIASFKSDALDENSTAKTSFDLQNCQPPEMTDSLLIEEEAIKIAQVVSDQSLSSSYITARDHSETYTIRDQSFSLSRPKQSLTCTQRKKSLPIGVVAKRALNYNQSHNASLENLSQLENVKPPSIMDEVLDIGDMENSMISVASIISEIADTKDNDSVFDIVKPVANVLSMTCLRYAESLPLSGNNSLSECLENINPPSLFNEVTEMDETLCSDTLCIDVDLRSDEAYFIDRIEEANDTDEAATPIPSSAESTPKKRLRGHLTPKQKRQLAKERYKTYTIAAEIVKKEEDHRRKLEQNLPRLTPKQRRQEDRNRFQTQVLEGPIELKPEPKEVEIEKSSAGGKDSDKTESPVKSGIPMLRKVAKTRKDERFRTRTINESYLTKEENVHTMLEQNANIVLNTLNETSKGDELLDCETLSLVSNESGSEHFLQLRFNNPDSKRIETRTRVFTYEAPEISRRTQSDFTTKRTNQEIREINPEIANGNQDIKDMEIVESRKGRLQERAKSLGPEESASDDDEEERQEDAKGPRIVKPGTISRAVSLEAEDIPKGIRGRRKPLFSNPTRKVVTPQSSPSKQKSSAIPIGRSNTSPIVRATRATTLRQNTNTSREISKWSPKHGNSSTNPAGNSSAMDKKLKRSSIPQKGSSLTTISKAMKRHSSPPIKLERQGTFTKDEPEVENAPTVPSLSSSPARTMTKIAKPKITTMIPASKKNFAIETSKTKIETSIPKKITATNSLESSIPKKITTLGQRSNSNSNIQPQKRTKETTSKIASLWKRVEDSKLKQKFEKPDTRKWITGNNGTQQEEEEQVEVEEENLNFRLFRSSTFEGLPKTISDSSIALKIASKTEMQFNGVKYRNSCDLSGIPVKHPERKLSHEENVIFRNAKSSDQTTDGEIDITKRISRLGSFIRVDESSSSSGSKEIAAGGGFRTTASAIVPPFNYNPHPGISQQQQINAKDRKSLMIEGQDFKSDIVTASARVTTV
ncbi:adenomatous polyposis coli protein-like isoform X2 [Leptopilina boulardi]|uniref:adenomatous polyposis coli protein-like isoform X2 n=1 Tax=Leptopilina boulardi TaxID=63433 RepID=UPI0021F65A91|nr:adenomatous polyposis coli protein-like isoform X2 [Leptopilina boulardi]XP_051159586.1 adenomatous polyposis coli protein-like isoform X2 [Leptopilina boulardi]